MTDVFGGYLAEIPLPHVRMFDDKRRRRRVSVTIVKFSGIGIHYHSSSGFFKK